MLHSGKGKPRAMTPVSFSTSISWNNCADKMFSNTATMCLELQIIWIQKFHDLLFSALQTPVPWKGCWYQHILSCFPLQYLRNTRFLGILWRKYVGAAWAHIIDFILVDCILFLHNQSMHNSVISNFKFTGVQNLCVLLSPTVESLLEWNVVIVGERKWIGFEFLCCLFTHLLHRVVVFDC